MWWYRYLQWAIKFTHQCQKLDNLFHCQLGSIKLYVICLIYIKQTSQNKKTTSAHSSISKISSYFGIFSKYWAMIWICIHDILHFSCWFIPIHMYHTIRNALPLAGPYHKRCDHNLFLFHIVYFLDILGSLFHQDWCELLWWLEHAHG